MHDWNRKYKMKEKELPLHEEKSKILTVENVLTASAFFMLGVMFGYML